MINPHDHDSLTDLEVDFARPIYAKFVGAQRLRQIIQDALENHECVLCKIYELKERGEIKRLPRCATHYDLALLLPRAVGGFLCTVCDQYVWPRETVRPSDRKDQS
jgi:hypothetical protein